MESLSKTLEKERYYWSLDALYKGYDDPAFIRDLEILKESTEVLKDVGERLRSDFEGGLLSADDFLTACIEALEKAEDYSYRIKIYTQLRLSVDSNDPENVSKSSMAQSLASRCASYESRIYSAILKLPGLDELTENNKAAKKYGFILREMMEKASHRLSDDKEEVLALAYPSGPKAFSDMYYALTGNAVADYEGKKLPLTRVKNMCHDSSSEVRRKAFLAELKAYEPIAEPLSFAISGIKRYQLMESELRGYKSPLEKMLIESRMKEETLNSMLSAINAYLPAFRTYLKKKASLLGYKNGLPWFEIYATLGDCDFNFSIEDCEAYILKHFKNADENLYAMTKRAFSEHWVDYPTRAGKQPGAFCENLAWIKESRIITNYNNTLSDIVTVAHELGHAFHGMMIEDQPVLNRNYCMPLAETASTFNENLIYNALISDMPEKESLLVTDSQLSALCQNILDIYARFLFEKSVFENVREGSLSSARLCELMKEALLKSFGDGLDPEYLHPYRWITKVHYYIPDIAFYNFPYTFGALFSRGLYAKYAAEGSGFMPKYEELLKATTTNTVEDVAMIAGIDLASEGFWRESLESITAQMERFLSLSGK